MRAELQRSYRVQDFATPGVIMRERSFVRPHSHTAHHKTGALAERHGEPVLCADVHRAGPGDAAAWGAGEAAGGGARRLPQHRRRPLHPQDSAAAHRAARLALAAARLRRPLLLPLLQVASQLPTHYVLTLSTCVILFIIY